MLTTGYVLAGGTGGRLTFLVALAVRTEDGLHRFSMRGHVRSVDGGVFRRGRAECVW
jgi:hypothetical protein